MWQAWRLSQTYRVRPSNLLGLDPEGVEALYLDRAVYVFGTAVESSIEGAREGKTGSQAQSAAMGALNRWLGKDDAQAFRQPEATR